MENLLTSWEAVSFWRSVLLQEIVAQFYFSNKPFTVHTPERIPAQLCCMFHCITCCMWASASRPRFHKLYSKVNNFWSYYCDVGATVSYSLLLHMLGSCQSVGQVSAVHFTGCYYYYYYYVTFVLFPVRGHTGYSDFELHILTTSLQTLITVFFANRLQSLLRFDCSRRCLLSDLENSNPCFEHFVPY